MAHGRALVLIHGVGTNQTIWSRVVPWLAEGHKVVSLDLPGFGHSPATAEWSLAGAADQVAASLREATIGPFDLVGSSLGGAVALTLADRDPEIPGLGSLILVAPAGFRPVHSGLARIASSAARPLLAARRRAGLRLAENRHARRTLLAGTVGDGAALDPEGARLILRASQDAASLRPAMEAAATADLRAATARLQIPLGLIWGSLDRVIPPHTVERILEIRPDAPIELIPGTGHIPHLEAPDRFAAAVERVLSQLP